MQLFQHLCKMNTARKCSLCCLNNRHKPINLPHKELVHVGRTQATGITDPNLSRNQVVLQADLDNYAVKITPTGLNPSGANGFCLKPNKEYILHHKDRLELLLNQYFYEVIFEPAPDDQKPSTSTEKRKRDSTLDDKPAKEMKIDKPVKQNYNQWEEIDDKKMLIYTTEGVTASKKIASYDLDGTIITTKSGARFPKDASDWRFLYPDVPKKLRELRQQGYKLVIFSNQAGISQKKLQVDTLREKIENVAKHINVPVQVFISTGKGIYRKPAPGMWDALRKQKNDGIEVDLKESFYCGDAAGRDKNWAPRMKKDFSIGDKLFALNIGVRFFTPEEHFLGAKKVASAMPQFDPKLIPKSPLLEPANAKIVSNKQEVVVFVGSPGSGKSSFCKNYLVSKGYTYISRDQLGSWQRCVNLLENEIKSKRSVAIDNTNPDKESRKRYIEIAKKHHLPCRCFVMSTTTLHAKHNNVFRQMTDSNHQPIADIIINSYKKKYEEPTTSEGFTEIVKVNCIPTFGDKELEKLYYMYLLEK